LPLRTANVLSGFALLLLPVTLTIPGFISSAHADVSFEFGTNGGYTDNLFTDSTRLSDRHVTNTAAIKFYPVSWLEGSLSGELCNYGELPSLSSRIGRVGLTAIPLGRDTKLSLTLSGSFDGRRYHRDFGQYDNNNASARVAIGYRLHRNLSCRVGVSGQTMSYLSSESGDKQTAEFFTGVNVTLLTNNSLDIELGYGVADYKWIDTTKTFMGFIDIDDPESVLSDGTLRSYYISPRFSRPLGSKTGLSVTFSYRDLEHDEPAIVMASSIGLLSPWTTVWEGTSVTATVKTYAIKNLTITSGIGYWNKTFLLTNNPSAYPAVYYPKRPLVSRDDDQERVFLQIVRPFVLWHDGSLQPRIILDYTHCNSTNKLFEYSGLSLETGINLKF